MCDSNSYARFVLGYKILFLDVLFPLDVKKIIYVDADQVVRGDLKELRDMDLKGAPYGYSKQDMRHCTCPSCFRFVSVRLIISLLVFNSAFLYFSGVDLGLSILEGRFLEITFARETVSHFCTLRS